MTGYRHTQRGHLHWLIAVPLLVLAVVSVVAPADEFVRWIFLGAVVLLGVLAASFMHLTVVDEGPHLAIRYGPVPLFSKCIPYERIHAVRAGRSAWIDGLGIHWVPGRGWTYNLWGRACVELELDRGVLRIGSDDVPALLAFLEAKTRESAGRHEGVT